MPIRDADAPPQTAQSLPTGTVTFLFTDIEGSTRLLDGLREAYGSLLSDQRMLLRAAFEQSGGFEVDTQGDSFFVAFGRASDALSCAVAAQRAIAAHRWPDGAQVRVRMGLHTGEPIVQRTGYVGMDVHRAARVAAAGHGGQILVSQSTRELVAADLPVGIELRSLGRHRLKDVREPVEIYQVEASGLATDFPALRTIETGDEPPTPGEPPYKGLEHFDESDARLFFGRERLAQQLVDRMTTERFIAVVGASGSGKSSLVHAGVLPRLHGQTNPRWTICTLAPGPHALEALALALTIDSPVRQAAEAQDSLTADARSLHLLATRLVGPDPAVGRVLVVVDQLEELFTLTRDDVERSQFVDNVLSAARADGPVWVLVTLRADFYDALAVSDLRPVVAEHQEYIGPMTRDELREAIEGPARAGGWEFVPGLVDLILHDVGEEPGALPLLSHALLETWRRRRGTTMTLKAYSESGGVRGAIARTADRVFHSELDEDQQTVARSIFVRLTELGEGTQDTRRRVHVEELSGRSDVERELVRTVLARLVDARLVTVGDGSVEVAHEALIREWPTLREWLAEDREGLRLHRQLTHAAEEWQLLHRDPSALYRGSRLSNSLEWLSARTPLLSTNETEFIAASQAEQEREAAERDDQRRRELEAAERLAASQTAAARRLRRRALLLSGALVVAALMAGAAILLGLQAQHSATVAQTNFEIAESQRLAGESSTLLQVQGSGELASLLALRGLQEHYSPQADMALQRAGRLYFGQLYMSHPRQVDQISISPDGAHLLTYARDGMMRMWSLTDGSLERSANVGAPHGSVAFAPDGTKYLFASEAGVELRDVQTDAVLWKAAGGADAQFVSDGQTIFVSRGGNRVDVLSATDGSILRSLPIANMDFVLAPDGRQLIVQDRVYDAVAGSLDFTLVGHTNQVHSAAFSPDGKLIATGSWDETAKIWNRATGQLLQTLVGHTEILFQVSFSPDSKSLVSGSLDNTARIWDVATGNQLRELAGHTGGVYEAAFTPDGNRVVTSSADGSARAWDMREPIEAQTISGHTSFIYGVAYSPDGKMLFTGSADGTGLLSDPVTLASRQLPYTGSRVDRAAFSPDGGYLLLGNAMKPPELWDPMTLSLIAPLDGGAGGQTADFSADGAYMVAAAATATGADPNATAIGLWNVSTRQLVRSFPGSGLTIGDITPDGRYVIVTTDQPEHNVTIYDAATGAQIRVLENGSSGVSALAVSPDNEHILTGSRDNNARVFDIQTGAVTQLVGHTNIVWGAAFTPDGKFALTGSQDRTARLWDVASGVELRRFASHDYSSIGGVAISPDGSTVAIGNFDGFAQLSRLVLSELENDVCGRLLRDFSATERVIYEIPDEAPTCK